MERNQVINMLKEQSEESYKNFHQKLVPGVEKIIGVRMAPIKNIAKEISREEYKGYMDEFFNTPFEELYYEEIMVMGQVIGKIKVSVEERAAYIEKFIPYIDNWAICDCFGSGLKFTKKNKEYMWNFIQKYLKDTREFYLRFGVVMLMDYFIEETYIEESLEILENISEEKYYVQMAVAWAISVCYVKFPAETRIFMEKEENKLDDFTYNKAIQKIKESYRVSKEDKDALNKLKRKPAKNSKKINSQVNSQITKQPNRQA